MLRMSVSESARTGRPATGLFHTLLTGNIGHRGASGRNGADAAPTGGLRVSVSNKAKPSASGVARRRLDEHTAFIAAIFVAPSDVLNLPQRTIAPRTIGRCHEGTALRDDASSVRRIELCPTAGGAPSA